MVKPRHHYPLLDCRHSSVLGNATISWTPPTQNVDGTALTDLAGYKIYYGTSASALNQAIQVSAGITAYVVNNLSPATYILRSRRSTQWA